MPEPRFVFAVDGGASKTEVELRSMDGSVLARHRGGPCNLYQDPDAGLAVIRAGWEACRGQTGAVVAETCLSAGLAGLGGPRTQPRFYATFQDFGRLCLSSDGYVALVGAYGRAPGAMLSIGTGTVGSRFDAAGVFTQLGGWGFLAGDRGGGAWLGLEAVKAWLEHREGTGIGHGSKRLWDAVEARLGTERAAILGWLRDASPAMFASLVPEVLLAASEGCDVAVALLREAGAYLARLARALCLDGTLELALSGGLAHPLIPWLQAALAQSGGGVRLNPDLSGAPLVGAWRIARGERPAQFTP